MPRIQLTGPGRGRQDFHVARTTLFNFDIEGTNLKPTHHDFLRMYVVPVLKRGGSVSIVGLASRTGSTAFNEYLSQLRAERTLLYLRGEVRNNFAALKVVGEGETRARAEGQPDNTEDARQRAVVVYTWNSARPLPVPRRIDLSELVDESLMPGVDVGDTAQKVIDIFGMLAQAIEEVPVDKISTGASTFGGFLNVFGAVTQMPLLWISVKSQSWGNGRAEGFWEAVQDMADTYADPRLDTTPLSNWPLLREPRPKPFRVPEALLLVSQREWMQGRRVGAKMAFGVISKKDAQAPYGAVRYLRAVSKQWGSGAGTEIRRLYNVMVGGDWPTRK